MGRRAGRSGQARTTCPGADQVSEGASGGRRTEPPQTFTFVHFIDSSLASRPFTLPCFTAMSWARMLTAISLRRDRPDIQADGAWIWVSIAGFMPSDRAGR